MTRLFTFVVLSVLSSLLGNNVLAQKRAIVKTETVTIDFSVYGGSGRPSNATLSFDNGRHPQINGQVVSDRLTVASTDDWQFYGSNTFNETYLQKRDNNRSANVYISGMKVGDVVTVWGESGDNNGGCVVVSDNTDYSGNMSFDANNPSHTFTITNTNNNSTLTLQFFNRYSGLRKITIESQIREYPHFDYDPGYEEYDMYDEFSQNDPHKEYNDNHQLTNSTYHTTYTLSDEPTGITLNGHPAQYMVLSNSKITANNRIAIDPSAGTWRFNFGLRAPANSSGQWANLSVCNLKEGDRVLFSYTGTPPRFSSSDENGSYDGSKAFADLYNDGTFDAGEDIYITSAANPVLDWNRPEGPIYQEDHNGDGGVWYNDAGEPQGKWVVLYYTQSYVITEDGHLDIAIAPDTRIVKFKIWSDHQASMVDEYDADSYTARFDITGELQAKEHIVPGGLEVHVGGTDASQHAHVVSSTHGPVSIVNAVDGYKIPGMSRDENGNLKFQFDLANPANIPETGTFYKFMPLEDGKLNFTFQAVSMNYYSYALDGDAVYYGDLGEFGDDDWLTIWDRPNEQTADVTCPYYLVKVDASGNKTVTTIGNILNGQDCFLPNDIDVKKGETYYLYGGWNNTNLYFRGSGQGQNNLEYFPFGDGNGGGKNACGVARLLEVRFNPEKKIYPLAKWVPNGTLAVKDDNNSVPHPDTFEPETYLADLYGYNEYTKITVKKMAGNITQCHPYIEKVNVEGEYNHWRLKIDQIGFADEKDKGGTILIKIGEPKEKTNPVYTLTIAYSTDPQFDGNAAEGTRGHIWDYSAQSLHGLEWNPRGTAETPASQNGVFTNDLTAGSKYAKPKDYGHYFDDYFAADISNYGSANEVFTTLPTSSTGLLYEEISGGDSDWMFNYNLVNAGKLYDPLFSNKYDLEGDNADLIWDTEGTVFKTSANQSVMFNEFKGTDIHASADDPDRYVGILKGGEFRIPWLRPDDRVIIYMGTGKGAFNDQAVFHIRNAYDALHNVISPDDEYIVGGSQWNGEDGDNNYRGCYHFFAQGHEGGPADMVFTMTAGSMCKIYGIQIYRGDRIITNEILGATSGDKYLLVSQETDPNDGAEGTIGDASNWTLKYFGKEQKLADGTNGVNNDIAAQTGNITKDLVTDTDESSDTYNTFTYPHTYGEIGTIRLRGKDMEKNMKYVADYADHNATIAYQETQQYPYTWDFTDATAFKNVAQDPYEPTKPGWFEDKATWDASYEKSAGDLSLWEETAAGYDLRLNSQDEPKAMDDIFETAKADGGNQIWAKGVVIPETRGLWFYTEDNDPANNGQLSISDDGMTCPYVVVPNVPANAAVYLRMTKTTNEAAFKYRFGENELSVLSDDGATKRIYPVEGTDDYIVALLNTNSSKSDLTLSPDGYLLKKLSVSTDPKRVNKYGWATESRDHVIDTELTSYLTGYPFKNYTVTAADLETGTASLAEIAATKVMPSAASDVSCAYAIHNTQNSNAEILNGGFHLFVPDMHADTQKSDADVSSNLLKAVLKAGTVIKSEGSSTSYVLTYQVTDDPDDTGTYGENDKDIKYVGFFPVRNAGVTSAGNQAYLPLSGASADKLSLVFITGSDADGILRPEVEEVVEGGTTVCYNLNGQQLNGLPSKPGLYIVNGKKVLVK